MYRKEDIGYLVRIEEINKECNTLKNTFVDNFFISSEDNNLTIKELLNYLQNNFDGLSLNNSLTPISDKNGFKFKDNEGKNYCVFYSKCLRVYNGSFSGLESVYIDVSDEQFIKLINFIEGVS